MSRCINFSLQKVVMRSTIELSALQITKITNTVLL